MTEVEVLLHKQQRTIQPPTLDSAVRRNNPAKTHLTSRLVSFHLRNENSPMKAIFRLFFAWISKELLVNKHQPAKAQTCCMPVVSVKERPKSLWHLPASCLNNFRESQRCTAGKCHRFMSRLPADVKTPDSFCWPSWSVEGLFMCLVQLWDKPKIFFWEHSTDEQRKGKLFGHPPQGCDKGCYGCQARKTRKKLLSLLLFLAVGEPPAGAQASVFSSQIAMKVKHEHGVKTPPDHISTTVHPR